MTIGLILATCLLLFLHCIAACTDTVYVGSGDGRLAISKDGGKTWTTAVINGGFIWSIIAHDGNVYVGTDTLGLAVSNDGGISWVFRYLQKSSGCNSAVRSVYLDEEKNVYALIGLNSACGRVAVSSDNGGTWPINFPLPNPPFVCSATNIYIDGPRIYAAGEYGLGFTDDMGTTWTIKNQSSGLGSYWVECVIGRAQSLYAGLHMDGGAVSMSKDGGRTWKTVNTTPTGLDNPVYSVYLQDDTLYVATDGGGLSWSSDFTTWTWKTTANGLASNNARAIIGSGNNLYLATDSGLSISRDKGQTWTTKTTKDGLPGNDIFSVFVQCR